MKKSELKTIIRECLQEFQTKIQNVKRGEEAKVKQGILAGMEPTPQRPDGHRERSWDRVREPKKPKTK